MKLTETRIEKLERPAKGKDRLVKDDGQPGLFVRVSASGSKTYVAQYSFAGQKRRVPLGSPTLAMARSAAAEIMGEVAAGRDPAADRKAKALAAKVKAERDTFTLGVLVDQWAALGLVDARDSYRREGPRAIRKAFGRHLGLPAAELTRATVVRVLDEMTKAGSPHMSARTAAYARACFSWAMKRGTLVASPFVNLALAKVTRRDRVLTDDELRSIWQATSKPGTFNSIVRMLLLSGQREAEVSGMRWDELSDDLSTWTIPASRAKNGKASVVPISEQAREIIAGARRYEGNALVLPGERGSFKGWDRAKDRLDKAIGVSDWRLHDLRRTVATNLQKLGVRLEVTESVLNHIGGSRGGIVSVYQRHDYATEKRSALDAWGSHVASIIEGRETAGNVVAFRATA